MGSICSYHARFHGVNAAVSTPFAARIELRDPDAACARCHREIYDRYRQTPMAQGSGLAANGLIPGEFTHAPSGITYRTFLRDGRAWLSYSRENPPERRISGEKELLFYIGSGHRGRTYLFQNQQLWFEAPINYYSKKKLWDMAPAYGNATQMPFTLPVDPNCLHCHAGDVQRPLPGARNRFETQPFRVAGISCGSCHGDATAHVASGGKAAILNPDKLVPVKRDSVCLQCHLEGEAAIYRPGKSLAGYRPGDDLSDYAVYFVDKQGRGQEGRATSQWEALLKSGCKRASGDKLTCTTCHDPHSSPTAADRVQFYRSKCLSCHSDTAFATTHHPEQPDCTSCHMPTRKSEDISHEQVTDHRILRNPQAASLQALGSGRAIPDLVPVGNVQAGDREYGLAYAQMAHRGDQAAGTKALVLLTQAEKDGANDPDLHVELGFLRQVSGDATGARSEYEAALNAANTAASEQVTALGNLAVLDAREGQAEDARKLLQRAFELDPSQAAAARNLAILECSAGDMWSAISTLDTLLTFSPDDTPARMQRDRWAAGNKSCR